LCFNHRPVKSVKRITPPKQQRADFFRTAIWKAIRQIERRMRKAYLTQPDSEDEADDWSNPEEWKP